MWNMEAQAFLVRMLWPMSKFLKSRSNFKVKSLGQKLWYDVRGLVTRNAHMQYESTSSSGLKVMAKVKVFEKKVKRQGQGH